MIDVFESLPTPSAAAAVRIFPGFQMTLVIFAVVSLPTIMGETHFTVLKIAKSLKNHHCSTVL